MVVGLLSAIGPHSCTAQTRHSLFERFNRCATISFFLNEIFVPFMLKNICTFFIRLVNVLVPRLLCVDFTRHFLACRFDFFRATDVIYMDVSTKLFSCIRVLGF